MGTTTMNRLYGNGWRVLERPRVPHEELEEFAREMWRLAFHGIPWPSGWNVRWAVLRTDGWPLEVMLGMCPYEAKLILIDEASSLKRPIHELVRTLVHELAHQLHPDGSHGPRWEETCDRATAYVLSELESECEPPPGSRAPELEPETWIEEWEYR